MYKHQTSASVCALGRRLHEQEEDFAGKAANYHREIRHLQSQLRDRQEQLHGALQQKRWNSPSHTCTHTHTLSPSCFVWIEGCSRRGESSSGAAVTEAQTNNRQWRERERERGGALDKLAQLQSHLSKSSIFSHNYIHFSLICYFFSLMDECTCSFLQLTFSLGFLNKTIIQFLTEILKKLQIQKPEICAVCLKVLNFFNNVGNILQ